MYCLEIQQIVAGKENGVLNTETINLMLTKHKNDWGLGPSLDGEGDSLTFGHGGKNAGFTNNMTAFANRGDAMIVMTNADNGGNLIAEIENAISKNYDWSLRQPKTIEVINLNAAHLDQYLGKYKLEQQGLVVEFVLKDNKLFAQTPIGNISLLPMSDTEFIDIETGTLIDFIVGERVEGFLVNKQMRLDRIDD